LRLYQLNIRNSICENRKWKHNLKQVLAFHLGATIDEERTKGKTKKQVLLRQRIQELSATVGSSDDVGVIGRQKTVPDGVGMGGGVEHFGDGSEAARITRRCE